MNAEGRRACPSCGNELQSLRRRSAIPRDIESHQQKYLGDESARLRFWTLGSAAITLQQNRSSLPSLRWGRSRSTVSTSMIRSQRLKSNLATMGEVDANSVEMRVSGVGLVPANYEPKTKVVTYAFTKKAPAQNLHSSSLSQREGAKTGNPLELHWSIGNNKPQDTIYCIATQTRLGIRGLIMAERSGCEESGLFKAAESRSIRTLQ